MGSVPLDNNEISYHQFHLASSEVGWEYFIIVHSTWTVAILSDNLNSRAYVPMHDCIMLQILHDIFHMDVHRSANDSVTRQRSWFHSTQPVVTYVLDSECGISDVRCEV